MSCAKDGKRRAIPHKAIRILGRKRLLGKMNPTRWGHMNRERGIILVEIITILLIVGILIAGPVPCTNTRRTTSS